MSKPPSCADVHADPPTKLFKHGKCASDSKVAGGVGVACLQYTPPHEERDVSSGGSSLSRRARTGCRCGGLIFAPTEGSRHPCRGVVCQLNNRFLTEGAAYRIKYEEENHRKEHRIPRGGSEWRHHRLVRRVVRAPGQRANSARRTRETRAPLGLASREREPEGCSTSFARQALAEQAQSRQRESQWGRWGPSR